MNRQRPLSSHLQIYKPQLTSILSILHRATGIALSMGSIILVFWVIALTLGDTTYTLYLNIINNWFGKFILFGFTFALFYHLSNGITIRLVIIHSFQDGGWVRTIPLIQEMILKDCNGLSVQMIQTIGGKANYLLALLHWKVGNLRISKTGLAKKQ